MLAAERAGFDSVWAAESYGSDAVSVLAWLAAKTETIQLGAAIMQVPARPPAAAAMAGVDDRRALRRPLHLRLRPLRAAGLRGLVRRPLREALGPHPRVRRDRREIVAREGRARVRGRALHAAADGRRGRDRPGQGAEAQLPPDPQRDPGLPRRDRPQVGRAGGRDRRRLDPDLLLGRRVARRPGASTSRPASPRAAARARTSRSRPSVQVAIDGDLDAARGRGQGGPAALPRRHGLEEDELLRRPRPTASASARSPTRSSRLYLDGKREEAYAAIPDELVDATSLVGTEDEVAERVKRFARRRRRPPDRLADARQRRGEPAHAREARRHGRRRLARLDAQRVSQADASRSSGEISSPPIERARLPARVDGRCYADDVVLLVRRAPGGGSRTPGIYEGKEAVGEWFGDWFRTFDRDYRFEIKEARELGRGWSSCTATHGGRGRLSGAPVRGENAYLYRVRDGKISQVGFFATPRRGPRGRRATGVVGEPKPTRLPRLNPRSGE